jgi:hypothetical protein
MMIRVQCTVILGLWWVFRTGILCADSFIPGWVVTYSMGIFNLER